MNNNSKSIISKLQQKIEICSSSFDDLNVKVQNVSISSLENCFGDDYLTINYLLFRTGRQSKQMVHVVISLLDIESNILQVDHSALFELKKRSLPYVGTVSMRLKHSYEDIAKIGVYLQEF